MPVRICEVNMNAMKSENLKILGIINIRNSLWITITFYVVGGGGHKQSEGQRKDNIGSKNNETVTEDLIQSRSIDHLLCGDDGNRLWKFNNK